MPFRVCIYYYNFSFFLSRFRHSFACCFLTFLIFSCHRVSGPRKDLCGLYQCVHNCWCTMRERYLREDILCSTFRSILPRGVLANTQFHRFDKNKKWLAPRSANQIQRKKVRRDLFIVSPIVCMVSLARSPTLARSHSHSCNDIGFIRKLCVPCRTAPRHATREFELD